VSKMEKLAALYERHIRTPWRRDLAGAERVMFVVYDTEDERALRARIGEFEQATLRSGHGWKLVDCTRWFAEWMGGQEYRDAYFEFPEDLQAKLGDEFKREMARRLEAELVSADEDTVVALLGVGSFYGFLRVSDLIHSVDQAIPGRLLVFFPGTKDGNNYRLLDARDGWNYLAHAITLHEGGSEP